MQNESESSEEKPIHVLEIVGNAIVGGMEKYVYSLAQNLPNHSFKVTCLAPYESSFTESLRHQGSSVYVTAMDEDPSWRSIQFTSQLVQFLNVDLIHAHLPKAHLLAGIVGKLTDKPVVATVHGMDIHPTELSVSLATGTHLTVVCQAAYNQALGFGVPADRLALIPNGVDPKTYSPNRSGASFRKALHLTAQTPLVGFVGRLAWEKGPDQFIHMAEHVLKRFPQVHFALVGEGPMDSELKELIQNLKLENNIHLPGLWTNTWEVYPAFDILAQTSRVEGMPFALLEGMACGCPVVAMGVGGVAEIVQVGTTGLLSAAGDCEGLGEAVIKLLENPEKSKALGMGGRKRVEDNFDIENTILQIARKFNSILGRPVQRELPLSSGWHGISQERGEMAVNNVREYAREE